VKIGQQRVDRVSLWKSTTNLALSQTKILDDTSSDHSPNGQKLEIVATPIDLIVNTISRRRLLGVK
jgi:hypothetical protein